MTGTVCDPVITGTPMRLHDQVLSFGKHKLFLVVCIHLVTQK